MFEHILIALDGSDEARSASALGLRVAHHMRARVTGLSVVDVRVVEGPAVETLAPLWGEVTGRPFQPELMRLYRERADSTLDQFCAAAEAAGLDRIERCVEIGVTEDVILDRAAEADLLVMGRRGEHAGVGRRALGATLWRVLHRAPCAVLVRGGQDKRIGERSDSDRAPRFPLVAWDRSPGARAALDLAIRYASSTDGQLRIVHAGPEPDDVGMEEAHAVLSRSNLTWESARLDLAPAQAVMQAWARWHTDCLFMGAFGRGRLRNVLFGSHTSEILEVIERPVFVAP